MTENGDSKKGIDTRRGVIEKAAATVATASLAGDTEQPPEPAAPLTQEELAFLRTSPLSGEVRRRIHDAGRNGKSILPILEQIHAEAATVPPLALYEYVLDITDYYERGERLNSVERDMLVDLIRHWPHPDTRVRMVNALEERAPTIADAVAAQEVATATKD